MAKKKTAAKKKPAGKVANIADARKKKPAPKVPRKPRQASLPTLEDHGILEIERAAFDYADARDERMRMTEVETKRHTKVLAMMKKHGKKTYRHRTGTEIIEITVTAKDPEERAKVKIAPATNDNIEKAAAGGKTKTSRKKKAPQTVIDENVEPIYDDVDAPGHGDAQLDEGDGDGSGIE